MRRWQILLLLFSGCLHEDCHRRHAQWLSLEECNAFCENYGGADRYDNGLCTCSDTRSSEQEEQQRRVEALHELGISEEQLREARDYMKEVDRYKMFSE